MDSKIKKRSECLHSNFFNVANKFPSEVAVTYYKGNGTENSVSYKELKDLSLEMVKIFLQYNVNIFSDNNTVYAICCDTGISAIVCMLSILQNGAFFYMSPELTEIEIIDILKKIPIKFIIVQKSYLTKMPKILNLKICKNFVILNDEFVLIRMKFKNVEIEVRNASLLEYSLAYVICTSGSTGSPKVIYVPHDCIVPNIKDFQKIFNITSKDTILSTSPLYFDPSIIDIFLGISFGARVLIMDPDILKMIKPLGRIIECNSISFMQITPALFRAVNVNLNIFQEIIRQNTLNSIALGGEMFPSQTDFKGWFDPRSKTKFYNLYGLTELSCWASCHEVDMIKYLQNSSSIPIGKPLTGVKISVTDMHGNKIDKGEGIIVITGERNICHIVDHNIKDEGIEQPINTGDIGYTDGVNIFCNGRVDDIVKRNACKISLTEIEIVSKYLDIVSGSCAVYYENKIVLFITTFPKYISNEKLIKAHLKKYLSPWKLPDKVMFMKTFPLNKNYKVDKHHLLKEFTNTRILPQSLKEPVTFESIKSLIEELWKDSVGCTPKEKDNFIKLGGNSLQAVQLAEKIQSMIVYHCSLILQTILNGTFEEICYLMNNNSSVHMETSIINDEKEKFLNIDTRILKEHAFRLCEACQGGYYIYNKATFMFNRKLKIIWTVSMEKCIDSSPLVVEYKSQVKIFIGSHSQNFYCIDNEGKIIWKVRLPDRIEGSGCLSKNKEAVYIGCYDGILYCFDVNDGRELWTIQTQGKIRTTCAVNRENGSVIFGSYDKYLYCCDESGKVKWKTKLSNGFISSTSIIANEYVFTGTLDGYVICLNIYNGSFNWKIFIGKPIFSSLAICHLGVVFGCTDNFIYCVSFDSQILWKYETEGPIFSSPSILEYEFFSLVVIGSHDNNLYLLDTYGNKIAIYQGASAMYSTPFIVIKDRKTFVVFAAETSGVIHSIEFEKHKETWRQKCVNVLHLNAEIFSSPVFYKEKIYIGCRNDSLYCLGT